MVHPHLTPESEAQKKRVEKKLGDLCYLLRTQLDAFTTLLTHAHFYSDEVGDALDRTVHAELWKNLDRIVDEENALVPESESLVVAVIDNFAAIGDHFAPALGAWLKAKAATNTDA